jgi:hypothetical protein
MFAVCRAAGEVQIGSIGGGGPDEIGPFHGSSVSETLGETNSAEMARGYQGGAVCQLACEVRCTKGMSDFSNSWT